MIALCSGGLPPNIAAVPRDRSPTSHCRNRPRRRPTLWLAAFLLAIAALAGGRSTSAAAAPPMSELVQAELLAEPSSIAPGQPFWLAVRLRMKEGWHTYWRNPGDSGESIAIAWQLPDGFEAGPIVWPTPHRLAVAHLMNFGFEGETALLTQVRPPTQIGAGAPIDIAANVSWLVCQKECIPGEARLSLSLPRSSTAAAGDPDPGSRSAFSAARSALPQASPGSAHLDLAQDALTLTVSGLGSQSIRSAYYFPYAETLIQHAAPQQHEATRDGLVLRIQRSALSVSPPATAGGVLVVEEAQGASTARRAFELSDVTISQLGAVTAEPATARRRAAGCRPRPSRRPDPQPDAVCISGALHQGARAHRAGGPVAGARARARVGLYRGRARGVCGAGRPAACGARGGGPGRLGLPAAVAGHRRRSCLRAVRRRLEPVGCVSSGLVAARDGAAGGPCTRPGGLVQRRRAGGRGGNPMHRPLHGDRGGLRAYPAGRDQSYRLPCARPGPGAAVPGPDPGAAAHQPPAAPRRLDGAAEAVPRVPRLCHRGLADLGVEPAGGTPPDSWGPSSGWC